MKIDCSGLACPEPVLQTKKALETLPNDSVLEVIVNSLASKENVTRFAQNGGFDVRVQDLAEGKSLITIVKGFTCNVVADAKDEKFLDKTLFLKSDKVGEGELGAKLIVGFLKSTLELPKLPRRIVCVNQAVLLTTADESAPIMEVLKALEAKGVEIYSCGVCLEFFGVSDKLKVGKIGNAFGTIEMLFGGDGTISL
ncbi:sulfurtransferase-like selenium metabolism protein YedF [Sulfurospirillum diekertiae]|uniref:Sulfurtransferase-like selenium metabolism protein YedF n=1 Tax=Sulfurospirillum diekertiae TaxID=1854492 RepID=A0A6G9VRW7_9BACT|nr:sulfurtransferase-like selenium metabolism protein YedF [Sulfurospirillum diekertiae]QIR75705.1 sulfurtransferase-like selenium metabolism protein YedF [Sulfurospirillum diekertiae]QIR78352.1 sulfurtransferase-like selenium metabolism protein YedF [Sulfurospirillum diekertiae]